MSTHADRTKLLETMLDRSPDWNRQHIDLWVAEARRLRAEELRRILSVGFRNVVQAIDALIVAPVTRGRMYKGKPAATKRGGHGAMAS